MKKPAPKFNIRTGLVIIVLAVILLILAVLLIQSKAAISSDLQRFETASKNKQIAFKELVAKMGTPIYQEEKNVCYNSEQGPYDDGRLWCQTASAAYFSEETKREIIENYFEDILQSKTWNKKEKHELAFFGAEKILCQLEVRNDKLANELPYYFSDFDNSKQTIVLVCVDRAKARHYQYTD